MKIDLTCDQAVCMHYNHSKQLSQFFILRAGLLLS